MVTFSIKRYKIDKVKYNDIPEKHHNYKRRRLDYYLYQDTKTKEITFANSSHTSRYLEAMLDLMDEQGITIFELSTTFGNYLYEIHKSYTNDESLTVRKVRKIKYKSKLKSKIKE